METVLLKVEPRAGKGKGLARRLRREGKVPGVFYTGGSPAVAIAIDAKEFGRRVALMEGSHIVRFESADSALEGRVSLVKDVQARPVGGEVLHVDFFGVDLSRKIRTAAPLHFVGKPKGVTAGGILQPVRREIEVECLPMDIPEFIEVDVSDLGIHDSFHVAELVLPERVEAIHDVNFTLVSVVPPVVIKEEAEEAPAEEVAVAGAPAAEPEKKEAGGG